MERIAPLAKILAEANGIDWRTLHGSGEGGLIVEGDILNYLTRIMSGEEEPPATPVDAPPPDWTGADVLPGAGMLAPGMPSMDMLSSAGVDSDLAALVAAPAPVMPPAPAPLEEESLEFELEDEQAAAPAPQPEREPVFAAPPVPVVEMAPPVTLPAPEVVPAAPLLGRVASPQPEPVAAKAEVTPPPAPPAQGGVRAGLGSLLSRLYQQPATPPAPPVEPTPAPAVPEMPALAPQPTEVEVPAAVAPVVEAPVVEPPAIEAPLPAVAAAEAPVVGAPAPEVPAPQPGVRDVPELEPGESALLAPAAPAVEERPEVQPAAPVAAEPAPIPQPMHEEARPREAVWFGAYLRRDANLAPAADLRRQLGAALGQDVPLALLVARATQRHAAELGLGTVAVQDLDSGRARMVEPGSLRPALAALDLDHIGTPDLLVIDAGTLGLDDLHLPHTVTLSVGRVQEGRAALTLNGDVDAARAARFLASVAGTLEEPIILVI